MVHPGQLVQYVKMPYLVNYIELERKATMILILAECRREMRQVVFCDTLH